MKHTATVMLCCLVVILASVPRTHALVKDISAIQSCDCYFSVDCSNSVKRCRTAYPGCLQSGKNDGACFRDIGPWDDFNNTQLSLVANAIDLWFEAYQSPTKKRGLPSAEIINRINKLELVYAHQRRVRFAVFNAIDVALGFDFVHPQGDCQEHHERCLGIFRVSIDPEGFELLKAVRIGFSQGFQKRNPQAITDPIRSYWEQYPKFKPHHTGRCYPHGHPEYEFKSVAECQIDELSRILAGLLAPAKSK